MTVSTFSVPEASGNYCERGVRFGRAFIGTRAGAGVPQEARFITFLPAPCARSDIRNAYHPRRSAILSPANDRSN